MRRARYKREWSQADVATRLQLAGFDLSRSGVGKIEAGLRMVSDVKLIYILTVFQVSFEDLVRKNQL